MPVGRMRALFTPRQTPSAKCLGVEEGGEVGVVNAGVGVGGDLGLGAGGDPEAGGLEHREVVGAVADREGLASARPLAAIA